MANYGDKYIIDFANIEGKTFRVLILEKEYVGLTYVLKGADSPFVLRYRDNGDEIYPAIRASEATIRFVSTAGFDVRTLLSEDDTAYKVEFYNTDTAVPTLLWSGFVDGFSTTDELLDDPRTISVKATDGLGLLKNQEFRDEDGAIIYSKANLINIIYQCIYKTGIHGLPLNVEINLFADGMFDTTTSDLAEPLLQCKVHTRSFVKKPQEYDNCYNVLQTIMQAFNATIFQANGYWHIVRFPDRWQSNMMRSTRYIWPWASAADSVQWQYRHNVNQIDVVAVNADHQRTFLPAAKSGVVTYDYDVSPEYYRSINFREGAERPSNFPVLPNQTLYGDWYDVDHWTYRSGYGEPNVDGSLPAELNGDVYRSQVYKVSNDIMVEEWIVIREYDLVYPGSLMSDTIVDVVGGEIVDISFETKQFPLPDSPMSPNTRIACQVVLVPPGATSYYYLHNDGTWNLGGVPLQISFGGSNPSSQDWQTISVSNSQPIPVAGKVYLSLHPWAATEGRGTMFKNLSISFTPEIKSGQRATVSQQLELKEKFERTVKIGDPTSNTVNGALHKDAYDTELWTKWYTYGSAQQYKLTEILALDLFRASKRVKTKVEGTIKGITTTLPQDPDKTAIISPHYHIQYAALPGYVYVPSSLEMNIEMDTARVYLYEFYHSTWDDANEQGDSREFKYIK